MAEGSASCGTGEAPGDHERPGRRFEEAAGSAAGGGDPPDFTPRAPSSSATGASSEAWAAAQTHALSVQVVEVPPPASSASGDSPHVGWGGGDDGSLPSLSARDECHVGVSCDPSAWSSVLLDLGPPGGVSPERAPPPPALPPSPVSVCLSSPRCPSLPSSQSDLSAVSTNSLSSVRRVKPIFTRQERPGSLQATSPPSDSPLYSPWSVSPSAFRSGAGAACRHGSSGGSPDVGTPDKPRNTNLDSAVQPLRTSSALSLPAALAPAPPCPFPRSAGPSSLLSPAGFACSPGAPSATPRARRKTVCTATSAPASPGFRRSSASSSACAPTRTPRSPRSCSLPAIHSPFPAASCSALGDGWQQDEASVALRDSDARRLSFVSFFSSDDGAMEAGEFPTASSGTGKTLAIPRLQTESFASSIQDRAFMHTAAWGDDARALYVSSVSSVASAEPLAEDGDPIALRDRTPASEGAEAVVAGSRSSERAAGLGERGRTSRDPSGEERLPAKSVLASSCPARLPRADLPRLSTPDSPASAGAEDEDPLRVKRRCRGTTADAASSSAGFGTRSPLTQPPESMAGNRWSVGGGSDKEVLGEPEERRSTSSEAPESATSQQAPAASPACSLLKRRPPTQQGLQRAGKMQQLREEPPRPTARRASWLQGQECASTLRFLVSELAPTASAAPRRAVAWGDGETPPAALDTDQLDRAATEEEEARGKDEDEKQSLFSFFEAEECATVGTAELRASAVSAPPGVTSLGSPAVAHSREPAGFPRRRLTLSRPVAVADLQEDARAVEGRKTPRDTSRGQRDAGESAAAADCQSLSLSLQTDGEAERKESAEGDARHASETPGGHTERSRETGYEQAGRGEGDRRRDAADWRPAATPSSDEETTRRGRDEEEGDVDDRSSTAPLSPLSCSLSFAETEELPTDALETSPEASVPVIFRVFDAQGSLCAACRAQLQPVSQRPSPQPRSERPSRRFPLHASSQFSFPSRPSSSAASYLSFFSADAARDGQPVLPGAIVFGRADPLGGGGEASLSSDRFEDPVFFGDRRRKEWRRVPSLFSSSVDEMKTPAPAFMPPSSPTLTCSSGFSSSSPSVSQRSSSPSSSTASLARIARVEARPDSQIWAPGAPQEQPAFAAAWETPNPSQVAIEAATAGARWSDHRRWQDCPCSALYVVGSHRLLGGWRRRRGIRLRTNPNLFPYYVSAPVLVPRHVRAIGYRFARLSGPPTALADPAGGAGSSRPPFAASAADAPPASPPGPSPATAAGEKRDAARVSPATGCQTEREKVGTLVAVADLQPSLLRRVPQEAETADRADAKATAAKATAAGEKGKDKMESSAESAEREVSAVVAVASSDPAHLRRADVSEERADKGGESGARRPKDRSTFRWFSFLRRAQGGKGQAKKARKKKEGTWAVELVHGERRLKLPMTAAVISHTFGVNDKGISRHATHKDLVESLALCLGTADWNAPVFRQGGAWQVVERPDSVSAFPATKAQERARAAPLSCYWDSSTVAGSGEYLSFVWNFALLCLPSRRWPFSLFAAPPSTDSRARSPLTAASLSSLAPAGSPASAPEDEEEHGVAPLAEAEARGRTAEAAATRGESAFLPCESPSPPSSSPGCGSDSALAAGAPSPQLPLVRVGRVTDLAEKSKRRRRRGEKAAGEQRREHRSAAGFSFKAFALKSLATLFQAEDDLFRAAGTHISLPLHLEARMLG
ncbi:hypothetical protein BESB_001260 [Besnoitia besnoiti]|uniref:Uncharacterized protein n=1 Tax=Besnoitia besnoiti TaxID=94643 RepID=A0A2A9MKN0_BESBE|nr:hypothetical protein BESB_001260 [Besnoitia besnoiti]PFH37784.1 hypothetical protein BESB_001260 [Besnoitia besnoiti]